MIIPKYSKINRKLTKLLSSGLEYKSSSRRKPQNHNYVSIKPYSNDNRENLYLAIRNNDKKKVEEILKNKPAFINSKYMLCTPLFNAIFAVKNNDFEILKLLLSYNVDINAVHTTLGMTVLHCAASDLNIELCQFLLDNHANPLILTRHPQENLIEHILFNSHKTMQQQTSQMIAFLLPHLIKAGASLESLEKTKKKVENLRVFDSAKMEYCHMNFWPTEFVNLATCYESIANANKQVIPYAYSYAKYRQNLFAQVVYKTRSEPESSDDFVVVRDEDLTDNTSNEADSQNRNSNCFMM